MNRTVTRTRTTKETDITVTLNLDGTGKTEIDTGIGFFDHMLNGFARHGLFDLTVHAKGDLEVDSHHTIEDTGIVLGQAILEAIGDKAGIKRYGHFMLPMDETLALCAVDLSGRPYLNYNAEFVSDKMGEMDTEMVREFFYAVSYSAMMNIHLKILDGINDHHKAEALFKAFGKALDMATMEEPRIKEEASKRRRTDMSYKRLIPCIFIKDGKAVRWIDDPTVVSKDVIELAKYYSDHGADELIVLDLSDSDEEHDETITLMKRINRVIRIPMIAGGNIRRQEDIKKILYTGAKRAMLNFSKPDSVKLIEDAAKRFGKEKLAVSLNDFDALFKHQHLIQDYSSEIVFMHRLDLNSIMNVTDVPCVIITDTEEESELFKILKCPGVRGLSGRYVSRTDIDCVAFKDKCTEEGIKMTSFESMMEFSQFKTNDQGLIPVIVQHYKTQEILMLAYMNEESFYETIKTGKMTYFSRSRQKLWVKGETSGHFQYVKSLTIDCDLDTLLAKVDQIGAACHTGNPTCFFQPLVGIDYDETNPLRIFESVYDTIADRKENPKEGSYTNYLFDKGIDKILKKIGEEATEVVIAAKNPNPEEVKYEIADFLYHAMVLMVEKGLTWEDIVKELADR